MATEIQKQKTYALIFLGMYSTKYGQLERYNVALAKEMLAKQIIPVYVYNKTPEVPIYLEKLKELGVILDVLNPDIGFLAKVKRIRKLIKLYKPTIVHTHFRGSIIRPVTYTAFMMGVPKRYNTFHCKIYENKLITKLWMKSLHKCCTQLFAVSDAIRNEQIELMGAPKEKIETLRLGVDKSLFENFNLSKEDVKKKYGLPQDGLLIANVAFHHHEKGIDVLLDAIKLLKSKLDTKVYLCQIGQELSQEGGKVGTSYTEYLKEKAETLGIKNEVIWLGVQNKVPEILSVIDIYTHPSREEGLGLILLEAFYSKIPVVASNVGGIPEVVDSEKGILVNKEQPQALADALETLIQNPNIRIEKGTRGYNYVNELYNLNIQINKLIDTYYLQ